MQQPPPVAGGQWCDRRGGRVPVLRRGQAGDRLRVVGLGAYRQQQLRPQLGRARAAQRVRAAQHPPVPGVADQVIAERGARAEHRGEPAPQPRVGAQRGEQVRAERHPGQGDQGQIRVGGGGQCGQQVCVSTLGIEGQVLAEQPLRPGCVSESHPGQFPGGCRSSARTHPCTVTAARGVGFPWSGQYRCAGTRRDGGRLKRPDPALRAREREAGEGEGRRPPGFRNGSRRSGAGAVRRRPRQGGAPGGVGALVKCATGR